MPENYENMNSDGTVKISYEVISTIAAVAVSEIEGASTLGGTRSSIAEIFGKKNITKGIKVTSENDKLTVDVNICVEFGCKIQEVAYNVQNNVKKNIELMSGLEIDRVNVHVIGVEQPKTEADSDEEITKD